MSTNEDPRREASGADPETTARSTAPSMPAEWVAQAIAEHGTDATLGRIIALVDTDPHWHDALTVAWDAHPQVTAEFEAFTAKVRACAAAALRRAPSTGRRFAGLLRK